MAVQPDPPIQIDPNMDSGHQWAFVNQNFQSIASVLGKQSFNLVSSSSFTINGTSMGASSTVTTTIPHNLGYVPVPFIECNAPAIGSVLGGNGYTNLPITYVISGGSVLLQIQRRIDSTNIYIDFFAPLSPGPTDLTGLTWSFKYYLAQLTAN